MKNFLPAFLWSIVIFALSAGPGVNLPESFWDFLAVDKLGHAFVYGLLTVLLLRGFYRAEITQLWSFSILPVAFMISAIYGIAMEIMQYAFFPGRYFEYLDILANIIGSFVGVYVFKQILR